ncbi:MAG: DUF1622 domain-containing protein [Candidatus Entotheonellia bacterium]
MEPGKGGEVVEMIRHLIERSALGIEVLAVAVIVVAVIIVAVTWGTVRDLFHLGMPGAYESYKHQLGKAMLLGLDLLVAADVVKTVALEPTLNHIAVLGLLVFIRTFLSWSLVVEIEGRLPWRSQAERDTRSGGGQGARAHRLAEERGS